MNVHPHDIVRFVIAEPQWELPGSSLNFSLLWWMGHGPVLSFWTSTLCLDSRTRHMTCGFKLEAIGVEGACGMAKAAPSPSGPAVASDGCLLKGAKRSPCLLTWMQVDQTIFHKVVGGWGWGTEPKSGLVFICTKLDPSLAPSRVELYLTLSPTWGSSPHFCLQSEQDQSKTVDHKSCSPGFLAYLLLLGGVSFFCLFAFFRAAPCGIWRFPG